MNEAVYNKIGNWFLKHRAAFVCLRFCGEILPFIIAAGYFILLVFLFITVGVFNEVFLKVLLIPAGVFVLVTLLRAVLNFKRPYEQLNISPLVRKDTTGKSFPSRHTASVFVIASAFFYINPILGAAAAMCGVFIAASRVLYGVHYIKDVVCAALIGIAAIVLFYIP